MGMAQPSVIVPFSGSLPEPEKPHLAPVHPLGVMVAVGRALVTDNEYWTEWVAVGEVPVTVTV